MVAYYQQKWCTVVAATKQNFKWLFLNKGNDDDRCCHMFSCRFSCHQAWNAHWTATMRSINGRKLNLVLKIDRVVKHSSLICGCPYVVLHHVLLLRHIAVELGVKHITQTMSNGKNSVHSITKSAKMSANESLPWITVLTINDNCWQSKEWRAYYFKSNYQYKLISVIYRKTSNHLKILFSWRRIGSLCKYRYLSYSRAILQRRFEWPTI